MHIARNLKIILKIRYSRANSSAPREQDAMILRGFAASCPAVFHVNIFTILHEYQCAFYI